MKTIKIDYILILCLSISSLSYAQIHYPIIAHSHNDYKHDIPIENAFKFGFSSLEVDIAMHGSKIVITHDIEEMDSKPLFETSYLIPLLAQIQSRQDPLILLVDIKLYSEELMDKLHSTVLKYEEHFFIRTQENNPAKKIQILLSGEIPRKEIIENEDFVFFYIDGRIEELENDYYKFYTPLISMNFEDISKWNGKTRPGRQTIAKLASTIKRIHEKNKKVRFWKTNETEITWSTLMALKVDFIGIDNTEEFYKKMKKMKLVFEKS